MAVSSITINPLDYQRLFRIKGLRFLINDLWMEYYKQLHCIAFVIDGEYTSYMPRKVMAETLQEGLDVYNIGNASQVFPLFEKIFLTHFEKTISLGEQLLLKMSRSALHEFLQELSQCFHYYSKTEFFYTDAVFENSERNKELQGACKFITSLKFKGREYLNSLFFGEKAILNMILQQLGERFAASVTVTDLQEYSVKELEALFEGKTLSTEELAQRREAFLMQGDGEKIIYFVGDEAKRKIVLFRNEVENTSVIKGVIANRGIVQGRVKVILSGYDNFDQLQSIIGKMTKGDILISETTAPELTLACQKAAAIVADQGGLLSHAAIISRELGIPCIVGTQFATKLFHDGDLVEVDAEKGVVRKIR